MTKTKFQRVSGSGQKSVGPGGLNCPCCCPGQKANGKALVSRGNRRDIKRELRALIPR